ncbi:MAG: type II toxin-antitoxin system HicB family antitoxin [Desulfopila sp.]
MSKKTYYAIFEKSGDWWAVRFPDAQAALTQGATVDEALEMAVDALSAILATGRLGREYQQPRGFDAVSEEAGNDALVLPVVADDKIMEEYRPKKRINIMVPVELLGAIDKKVKSVPGMDRSRFFCEATERALHQ